MLIDLLGHGFEDARREKPILRLACAEAFASDLGGQFCFWKMFACDTYEISNVETIDGQSVSLDEYVDKLICDHISMLESKEEELVK